MTTVYLHPALADPQEILSLMPKIYRFDLLDFDIAEKGKRIRRKKAKKLFNTNARIYFSSEDNASIIAALYDGENMIFGEIPIMPAEYRNIHRFDLGLCMGSKDDKSANDYKIDESDLSTYMLDFELFMNGAVINPGHLDSNFLMKGESKIICPEYLDIQENIHELIIGNYSFLYNQI